MSPGTRAGLWGALACAALSLAAALALLASLPERPLSFTLFARQLELLEPRGLILLALGPFVFWAPTWSLSDLSVARRAGSTALRCASLSALALALARPVELVEARRISTVFLVDVSDSIDAPQLEQARAYVARALALRGEQPVAVLTFAGEARRIALPARADQLALARHPDGRASNLERALSVALGLLEPNALPQLALFSDLRETHGSLARALGLVAERGATLLLAQGASAPRAELGLAELSLPAEIRAGEPFELRARVAATRPGRARLRLFQDGAPNPLDASRELALEAGETSVSFRSLSRSAGKVDYRLELLPESEDQFAENNRLERAAFVRGPPRVLYVEREAEQAHAFSELLRQRGFDVDVRGPAGAPQRADELAGFDFYVLSDVPADALSRASLEAVRRYLLEGGGFMMAGGERAFGLGGYRGSALEPLLPVLLDSALRRDEPSLALELVLDKSGSMAGEKLERAKEAAIATAELLGPKSLLGVVGFDTQPLRVVRLSIAQKTAFARQVGSLASGGGTALFPALDAAYVDLAAVRARIKHVVLLTDGQTQEESLSELTRSMRADGITISTIGLGEDVNRGLLEQLALLGGGRSYFTRDPSKVPRLFSDEAELLTRSLTIEEYVRAERAAPADFLKGIPLETAPYLRGYVATRARPAPAQVVLASDRGEPLLARMRVGLGWSLAFTSDVKPRWSAQWHRWPALGALFAQLVREHMRREASDGLPIETWIEGDTLHAAIDVLDARERFVSGLTGSLAVSGPAGLAQSVALRASAPGRYQASVPLPALGAYSLRAELAPALPSSAAPAAPPRLARGSASHSFPAEYRIAPASEPSSRAALSALGSHALPSPEALFEPTGRELAHRLERWPAPIWLALVAFLLDIAVRRMPPLTARRP